MKAQADRFSPWGELIEATAIFLFFYQALRVLFSVLFGLIYDAIFAEVLSFAAVGLVLVVVILALLAPLAAPRRRDRLRIALLVGAVVVFLARIPLTLNEPRVRLWASILIVAGTGLYLAARLRHDPRPVVRALLLALVLDQTLRVVGDTWDVSLRMMWLPVQVVVSLVLCLLTGWLFRWRSSAVPPPAAQLGLLTGLAWGGWLFLEMSLLAFPNAVARWSGMPYATVAPLLLAVTFLPLVVGERWMACRLRSLGLVSLAALLAGLLLGYLISGPAVLVGLLLAQVAALLLLPFCLSVDPAAKGDRTGWGLALGGLLFLILGFAYAFTFTYAYTLDLFRGMGLPVFAVAGLLMGLPLLQRPAELATAARQSWRRVISVAGLGCALTLVVFILAWGLAWSPLTGGGSLRVATYNIHYGYDTTWRLSLAEQAEAIVGSGADVVILQEVDTGRPTSYMIDNALWLAQRLDMQAVYLPTMEHLTGIALLSRYPILDSETMLLPSELEQTGIIWAKLDVCGTEVNAFAIWLGLKPEERARQLDAALPFIEAHPGPAVFGGDFNSAPDSPVYTRIAGSGFVDPFLALGLGSPPTDPALEPDKRIDFVWVRGLQPLDAQVSEALASDHRLVVIEVGLP